jgi:hypothetical protein
MGASVFLSLLLHKKRPSGSSVDRRFHLKVEPQQVKTTPLWATLDVCVVRELEPVTPATPQKKGLISRFIYPTRESHAHMTGRG